MAADVTNAEADTLIATRTLRERFTLSRWLFLRLLGVVYFLAIAAYWRQFPGLIGENGIQPAAELLRRAAEQFGPQRYLYLPTLCWLSASDAFINGLCMLGIVAAAMLITGFAPLITLPVLWAIYLSLVTVGGVFYGFQWDALLLETGLLAIAIAPAQWYERPSRARPAPPIARWLIYLLLFKLMFLSGLTKLSSLDPTWRDLSALDYHYFTQPLPNPISWYLHQMPRWFARVSVVVMFAVELGAPLLMFFGCRARRVCAVMLITLQLLIAATGNYGFFNALAIVLCVPLLDDALFAKFAKAGSALPPAPRRRIVTIAFASIVLPLSLFVSVHEVTRFEQLSGLRRILYATRSINGYGLFRVMTTTRPEIIIEGSDDGRAWQPYRFTYKPGDPGRRPPLVAPYHPRLDWQMWFAALGSVRRNPWFVNLLIRLAQNEPAVTVLLEKNPFPDEPPRYLRATVWQYTFTTGDSDDWWQREQVGDYTPVIETQRLRRSMQTASD